MEITDALDQDAGRTLQELWNLVRDQQTRLETQARQVADLETELRAALQRPSPDRSPHEDGGKDKEPPNGLLSRSGLLKLAAMGAAGIAASGIVNPGEALADTGSATSYTADGPALIGFNAPASGSFTAGVQGFGSEYGVHGLTQAAASSTSDSAGVVGESSNTFGVIGITNTSSTVQATYAGVLGNATANACGVFGQSQGSVGVAGVSATNHGIDGQTNDTTGDHAGVFGFATTNGYGVIGSTADTSGQKAGVLGDGGNNGFGVAGKSTNGTGVLGETSDSSGNAAGVLGLGGSACNGVQGTTDTSNHSAIFGLNNGSGPGVRGRSVTGPGVVGVFGSIPSSPTLLAACLQTAGPNTGLVALSASGSAVTATTADNSGNSAGVLADGGNACIAVLGSNNSPDHSAIFGLNNGSGPGVRGRSVNGPGVVGVFGSNTVVPNTACGVLADGGPNTGLVAMSASGSAVTATTADSSGNSAGVLADGGTACSAIQGTSNTGSHSAIFGLNNGNGPGVRGRSASGPGVVGVVGSKTVVPTTVCGVLADGSTGIGLVALSSANTGISSTATGGRAGVFQGSVAPIQLVASTTLATHPASGARGDLFVDSRGNLWFCKGGSTWVHLA